MEIKKSPKADLESYAKLFMLLGLLFALFVVYKGFEYKAPYVVEKIADKAAEEEIDDEIPITQQEIEEVKPPPPPPPPAPEVIEVIEDDSEVEEAVLESTETDEEEVIEEVPDVEEVEEVEEEEEIDEVISFRVIENVAIFPGCTGSKAELSKCMSKKISKHVNKHFNIDLAQDLNLAPGKKRIGIQFVVNKQGNIVDIRSRAPHPKLKAEAERIIKMLPKMIPGKQRNKPVKMSFTLPINFVVTDD